MECLHRYFVVAKGFASNTSLCNIYLYILKHSAQLFLMNSGDVIFHKEKIQRKTENCSIGFSWIGHTVKSRYLELGYLEYCETRSVCLN